MASGMNRSAAKLLSSVDTSCTVQAFPKASYSSLRPTVRSSRHAQSMRKQAARLNTSRRFASTAVPPSSARNSGVKVGPLFLALSILGLGATSLGLYNYYNSMKTFPPELRSELRSALRCKARNDYLSSHKFFSNAWEKATSPEFVNQLGILKVTGIGISWAEMLEEASHRADEGSVRNAAGEAYTALRQTYTWARDQLDGRAVTEAERMRVVSIAVKLADMAEGQAELEDQTEKQLTWAVEEILRLSKSGKTTPVQNGALVGEMDLPPWVTKTDMGGTLESLGNLYARKGNVEYAMPLYLQTISLLMPPPTAKKQEPSTGEKCHAATIMNNLSSLIASAPKPPSKDIRQSTQAFAWATKASQIASYAIESASEVDTETGSCKPVLTVALYNLGMLRLMEGDKEGAKKYLEQAKAKGKEWGLKEAEIRASEVIRSL